MPEDKPQNTDPKADAKTTDLPSADAPIQRTAPELPAGVVASLPDKVAIHSGETAPASSVNHPPVFSDEFAGKSGSFVIDGKTGERKRQYTPVYQGGEIAGYRVVA